RKRFRSGTPLLPQIDNGSVIAWNLLSWRRADVAVIAWQEGAPCYVDHIQLISSGVELPKVLEHLDGEPEIVVTPFDIEDSQGPTEVVLTESARRGSHMSVWLGRFCPGAPTLPVLDRLRNWPAPVLGAFVN